MKVATSASQHSRALIRTFVHSINLEGNSPPLPIMDQADLLHPQVADRWYKGVRQGLKEWRCVGCDLWPLQYSTVLSGGGCEAPILARPLGSATGRLLS